MIHDRTFTGRKIEWAKDSVLWRDSIGYSYRLLNLSEPFVVRVIWSLSAFVLTVWELQVYCDFLISARESKFFNLCVFKTARSAVSPIAFKRRGRSHSLVLCLADAQIKKSWFWRKHNERSWGDAYLRVVSIAVHACYWRPWKGFAFTELRGCCDGKVGLRINAIIISVDKISSKKMKSVCIVNGVHAESLFSRLIGSGDLERILLIGHKLATCPPFSINWEIMTCNCSKRKRWSSTGGLRRGQDSNFLSFSQ